MMREREKPSTKPHNKTQNLRITPGKGTSTPSGKREVQTGNQATDSIKQAPHPS